MVQAASAAARIAAYGPQLHEHDMLLNNSKLHRKLFVPAAALTQQVSSCDRVPEYVRMLAWFNAKAAKCLL